MIGSINRLLYIVSSCAHKMHEMNSFNERIKMDLQLVYTVHCTGSMAQKYSNWNFVGSLKVLYNTLLYGINQSRQRFGFTAKEEMRESIYIYTL